MRIGTTAALIAIVALATVLGTAGTASAATTVTIGDNFFAPSSKTIAAGTKVRFNWTGKRRHSVKKKSGPGGEFKSVTTKSKGVNFAKTFSKTGVYRLICTVHPDEMKLKLTVD
jgi:plastocyanin